MAHTVAGAFDDVDAAQAAIERLLERGFARDAVRMTTNQRNPDKTPGGPLAEEAAEIPGTLARVLGNLFGLGDNHEDARRHAEAVRRGGILVTVEAADAARADEARAILDQFGAVDLDERAARWESGPGAAVAAARPGPAASGERRGARIYPPAPAQEVGQARIDPSTDPATGVPRNTGFEAVFRDHFRERYGSAGATYEDYALAYRYGYVLAHDEHFAGRPWDEVESEARWDWESRNPALAWGDFRDAVRFAWEYIRGLR